MQTIKAWHSSPGYAEADDLKDADKLYFSNNDMRDCGWLCVGEADIVLRINVTPEDLAMSMCDTLKQQIQKIQADAQQKVTELQSRINDLQAITYSESK